MFLTIFVIFIEDDSPHPITTTMAAIGLIGATLLLIGGIVGAYVKRWVTLLPGTILLLLMFASLDSSMRPYLSVAVVMSVLLLLRVIHCYMTGSSDRRIDHATFTHEIDRCLDMDGNIVLISFDDARCDDIVLAHDCRSDKPLISLG